MKNAFSMTPSANLPPVSMPAHNYVTINVPFVKIRNTWEYIRRTVKFVLRTYSYIKLVRQSHLLVRDIFANP